MTESQTEDLRYPIGKFNFNADADEQAIQKAISEIEKFPTLIREAVKGLSDHQLDTPYRDGGWSVRQVVHHLADSHINAYIRVKFALTENNPIIKPYEENAWAQLEDSKLPVEISLSLLEALHQRWVFILKKLSADDLNKTVVHPQNNREMSVKFLIFLYAWHGAHHTAHVTELRKRMKW